MSTSASPSKQENTKRQKLSKEVGYFASRQMQQLEGVNASTNENANKDLTDILLQVGLNEKNSGNHVKYNAYVKACNAIRIHPHRITSGAEAQKLDGVGKKIALKIDEILSTGSLEKLKKSLEDPMQRALNAFNRIHGVGPVAARQWYRDGIETIDQLRAKVADGTVKLTSAQALGLKYLEAFEEKIPRDEMRRHEKLIVDACAEVDASMKVQIVGSYRREKDFSGDIDVLVMHPTYDRAAQRAKRTPPQVKQIVERLRSANYIIDTLSLGGAKFMGVCQLPDDSDGKPRRLDIKIFPLESFPAALLHFTGSGELNRQLRGCALARSMTLSEYGLQAIGQTGVRGAWLPIKSEKDIFAYCGVKYLEPNERSL